MWQEHFIDEFGKFGEAGARHNDGVAVPLRLLGDTHETTTVVFLDLNSEIFALHFQFTAFQNLILGILAIGIGVGGLMFVVHEDALLEFSCRKINRIHRWGVMLHISEKITLGVFNTRHYP